MKKTGKSNSGFTLIELIIAIAILAFLMTAIASFMGSGVLSFKKAKADITVHNSAQDTYNQLMDSIMQSNDIVVYAYTVNTTPPEDGSPVVSSVDFSVSGDGIKATLNSGPRYYVRDKAQWDAFKVTDECKDAAATPIYYKDIPEGTTLYVKEIITDVSIPVDLTYATPVEANNYENDITDEIVSIKRETHKVKKDDGSYVSGAGVATIDGDIVYNVKDTQRNIFTFDKENMYYETRYAFMTGLNDVYDSSDDSDSMSNYLYTESLSYVENKDSGVNLTGCVLTVDAKSGAVDIDLMFSDKNATYTTQGMVKFRNSYVLRAKK